MKNKKLVSVIIPTYSRPDFILRAIESIKQQTYIPIELLVVDDNGKGTPYQLETEEILQKYIIKNEINYIVHDINKNGSAARNTGWKASKGNYLVFHDDDDVMAPTKIEEQVNAIESSRDENVMASYCNCVVFKKGRPIKKYVADNSGQLQYELLASKWSFGSGSNILMKREAMEKLGGYDESFLRHQDLEIIVRFFRYFKIVNVNKDLLYKIEDSKPRIPNMSKMLDVENEYLVKFKNDINNYSEKAQKYIYYVRYLDLAILAANYSEYRFCKEMVEKACSYKMMSLKDFLRMVKHVVLKPQAR